MSLTIEQQKRLTEFLGECWHETELLGDESYRCTKCGFRIPPFPLCLSVKDRLDFNDWRVVGRLIEKYCVDEGGLNICPVVDGTWTATLDEHPRPYHCVATPQLAICLAIDAWLVAKEEEK